MNIFNKNVKAVLLIALFFLSTSYLSATCIDIAGVTISNEIDNGDGTCTYEVNITIASSTTASTADFLVEPGSISTCNGGGCTSVSITPGGVVTASITKDCAEVIKLGAFGFDTEGVSCGDEALNFSGLEPLPVELVGFEASVKERVNELSWKTATEENALAFVIQKSLNGPNNFETIGRVNAVGNSSVFQSYSFTDDAPHSLAYYRLQMIDMDGSFEFSEVLVVERAKTDIELIEVFPVPAVDNEVTVLVHAAKDGYAFIDLFDMSGRSIKQDRIELKAGVNSLLLDWQSNEGNLYFFTIYNGRQRISKKILKSNLD